MVTTRKSIRTIRSTIGMRKIRPGPFAPSNFPKRKITPRSYSRRIRIACGRMITARMMRGMAQLINLNGASSGMALFSFGFYFLRQSLHGCDLCHLSFFYGSVADRVPMLAFDKDPAAARVDWSQCSHGFSKQSFRTRSYRQALRAKTLADNENKERRSDQCRRNDVAERQPEKRIGAVKEHERADQERNDSADS